MAARYGPFINQLRATLRGKQGAELLSGLRKHIQASEVPILVADNSSRYIAANTAASALTGYSPDELLGMRVADLTPPMMNGDAQEMWADFISQGAQRGEFEIRARTGHPVRVRYWAYASVVPGVHVSLLMPV